MNNFIEISVDDFQKKTDLDISFPKKDTLYKVNFSNGYRFLLNGEIHCEFGPADVLDEKYTGHYYLNDKFLFSEMFLIENNIKPPTSLNEIKKIMLLM